MIPVAEGKTKRLLPGLQHGTLVLETKNQLTGGDAAKVATIEGISVHKTSQAANVFYLLEKAKIPNAFVRRFSPSMLVCFDCEMLPIEWVMRRYAWGSFLKRNPRYTQRIPRRFNEIQIELFHKDTVVTPPLVSKPIQMSENKARELYLTDGHWAEGVYTDPLIQFNERRWQLHSAKEPVDFEKPLMVTKALCNKKTLEEIKKKLLIPCFNVLEKAWSQVETADGSVVLADLKIEIGRCRVRKKWVIADVIDNDSWRIWPGGDPHLQLDKQNFRDGHPLHEVENQYALVAQLTEDFYRTPL